MIHQFAPIDLPRYVARFLDHWRPNLGLFVESDLWPNRIMASAERGIPLVILAGKEYGSGSSRDWAAKGPRLLGVRAVIAESYERIHRSNLVGMGILPLQFLPGENAETLKLTGEEIFGIAGIREVVEKFSSGRKITVRVKGGKTAESQPREFQAIVRIDTPQEALYYANGGILQYVLRQLLAGKAQPEAVTV